MVMIHIIEATYKHTIFDLSLVRVIIINLLHGVKFYENEHMKFTRHLYID